MAAVLSAPLTASAQGTKQIVGTWVLAAADKLEYERDMTIL